MICPNCKSHYSSICLKCGYDPKTQETKFAPEDLGIKELPHVPMETSHIWLGRFRSDAAVGEYFDERIYEDDEAPMNRFAEDQGVIFYDHDWVERSYCETSDLRGLVRGHSYSDDYLEEVTKLAREREIEGANVFVLADVNEFQSPRSIESRDYRLWYLGTFKCTI